MEVLYVIAGILVLCVIAIKLFFIREGNAKVEVRVDQRTPFKMEELTKDSVTFSTKIEFANAGTQCATIMDCFVRVQLPYEQFDGVKVEGKAEWEQAPREDDYFESVLIQKKKSIYVLAKVKLIARKNGDIKETLTHMVDLPMDIIYLELGRRPWRLLKEHILLPNEEIAKIVGIELAED